MDRRAIRLQKRRMRMTMQMLDHYCRDLARFVGSAHSGDELAHVLRALLTPAEIESIAQRLSILDGISTGIAQREIAETLRVGIATVTRGSRVWQENRECLGKYFPRPPREGSAVGATFTHSGVPQAAVMQDAGLKVTGIRADLASSASTQANQNIEPEASVS